MDDTYLKTVFWLMVILYSVAIIGIWENFIQPFWNWGIVNLGPLIIANWQSLFR